MTRKRALLLLGLLAAMIVGFLVWVGSFKPMVRKWTLSNGAELELVRVTVGKNHRAIDGGWKDMVYPFVPEKLRKKWNWQVGKFGPTSNDTLVVWVKAKALGTTANPRGSPLQLRFAVLDENGLEAAFRPFRLNTSNIPQPLELRNYPRRSPQMNLRIYDDAYTTFGAAGFVVTDEHTKPMGEFKIANPAPSGAIAWVPEKLPASRSTNGLTISLVKLQTGFAELMGGESSGRTNGMGGRYSRATIDFQENGERATDWWVSRITASSASGEQLVSQTTGGAWIGDRFFFGFQGPLWIDEPAWKLSVEAWRSGRFPVQEVWTVRGIRAPHSNEVVAVNARTNICGVDAELIGFGGPEAKPPEGWSERPRSAKTSKLRIRLADANGDVRLSVLSVKDELGKTVQAYHYVTGKDIHEFAVEIPESASNLDVTLAASRSRTVEFIVKPELAK